MNPFIVSAVLSAVPPSLPPLHVQGKRLLDPSGKQVLLKGCNLGNWFVLEMWMFGHDTGVQDQFDLTETLKKRFGLAEAERLMEVHRENWITEKDFANIRSFGFNVVRIPLNYRQFEDDERPMRLRRDAWKWVDRAIDMAERHGLYSILDMHGAQGGQSVYDHTGRSGQNKLWSEPAHLERLAWLWGELAKRYRNRAAVAAYDVVNEPYGGSHEQVRSMFARVLASIRKNDPDKLVFAPSPTDGFALYGDPKANGWRNVGITEHHYPGLFGNGEPTVLTHAKHLAGLELVAKEIDRLDVPYLVGEMNVVFNAAGGAEMMRRTYDAHAKYGWSTTMWSYRVVSAEGGFGDASWAMATNAKAMRRINFATADKEEIERFFRDASSEEMVLNEALRTALTARDPKLKPLPSVPTPVVVAPQDDVLAGWLKADVGKARKGGLVLKAGSSFELWGAGADVWGRNDQCRFLYREVDGDFDLSVRIDSMVDVHAYAKAGLMVRGSLDADAPTTILTTFPSGEIQHASRPSPGAEMSAQPSVPNRLPVFLRLQRRGSEFVASYGTDGRAWAELARTANAGIGRKALAGVLALSHDDRQLVKVGYSRLELR